MLIQLQKFENPFGMNWTLQNQYVVAALIFSAIVPVFLGSISPYFLIVVTIGYYVLTCFQQGRLLVRLDLIGWSFVGVFIVQVLLAILSAQTPTDYFYGLNFLPVLLYLIAFPVLTGARIKDPVGLFAHIALFGAVASFIFSAVCTLYLVYVVQYPNPRVNFGFSNVNDLSGLALLFGFLALVGLLKVKKSRRNYLGLGPLAALATILITESRGALLAFVAMSVVSAWFLTPKQYRLRMGVTLVVLGIVVVWALSFVPQLDRIFALPGIFMALMNGEVIADNSANQRLLLYGGGINAFLQAPIIGHGWANFMNVSAGYIPGPAQREALAGLPQLHNDLINFAASGGIVGLGTYIVCLLVPIIAVRRSGHDKYARVRKMGVVLLITCYGVRGLTDLMIGFEYGTTYYVIVLAIFMALFRVNSAKGR